MRFRFSIRDLLWLTLVVAVALGWLAREQHLEARWRSAIKECAEIQRVSWGAVNTLEDAMQEHGYVVFWQMGVTSASPSALIRSPDGTETKYEVRKFTSPYQSK